MKNISLDIQDDGIGVATFDMPGRPFNVFSEDMMDDLEALIAKTSEMKGLVITSGKQAFIAGADLMMIKDFANMRFYASHKQMRERFSRLGQLFRQLEKLPIPVVAAINGLALGGGLEIAMACHGRVCVQSQIPVMGLPEIKLGLFPGAGGTQRLPRLLGIEKALSMLLSGNPVTPEYALENGLIDEIAPAEQLLERAIRRVKYIQAKALWDADDWSLSPTDKALLVEEDWQQRALQIGGWNSAHHDLYPAVSAIIDCVAGGADLQIDAGMDVEWNIFTTLMTSPVPANMVVTGFLNKTAAPKWARQHCRESESSLQTITWQSSIAVPARVRKALSLVSDDEPELVVVDAGEASCSNAVELRSVQFSDRVSSSDNVIDYFREFVEAEAVEITATAEFSKRVLELTLGMGKVPVWGFSPTPLLRSILCAVQSACAVLEVDSSKLVRAAQSVDAISLFDLSKQKVPHASVTDSDRSLGLELLVRIALDVWREVGQLNPERAAELDLLAVFGAGWPQWTGGPVSYLAMLQRGELAVDCEKFDILGLTYSLKDRASYTLPAAKG